MIVSTSLKIAIQNKGNNANTVGRIIVKAKLEKTVVANCMIDSGNTELRCQQLQFYPEITQPKEGGGARGEDGAFELGG